jgi:hypothetical protein
MKKGYKYNYGGMPQKPTGTKQPVNLDAIIKKNMQKFQGGGQSTLSADYAGNLFSPNQSVTLSPTQQKVMRTISNLPVYSPDARFADYQDALPYWQDNVAFTPVIQDKSNFGPNNSPSLGSYFSTGTPSPYANAWRSGNIYTNPSLFDQYDNEGSVLEHETLHAGFNGRDVPQWMIDNLNRSNRNPGSGMHENMLNEQLVNQAVARQSVLDEFGLEGNATVPQNLSDEYLRRGMYSAMRNPNAPTYKNSVAEAISGNKPGSFNNLVNYRKYGGDMSLPNVYPNQMVSKYKPGGVTGDPNKPYDAKTNPDGYFYAFGKKFHGKGKSAAQQAEEKKQVGLIKKYADNKTTSTTPNFNLPSFKPQYTTTGLDFFGGDPRSRIVTTQQMTEQANQNAAFQEQQRRLANQTYISQGHAEEPWEARQRKQKEEEDAKAKAQAGSDLAQTMGLFTPSGSNTDAGVIGATTMANMLPGTGQFLSGARLYDFARVPKNNQYFNPNNGTFENIMGGIGLLGDVANIYGGFKMSPQNVGNVAEDITAITGVPKRNDINVFASKQNTPYTAKPITTQAGVLGMTEEELAQAMKEIEEANIPQEDLEFNYNPTEQQIQERTRLKNLFNKIDDPDAPEITAEEYRNKMIEDQLRKQAGDILRSEGAPDPYSGGSYKAPSNKITWKDPKTGEIVYEVEAYDYNDFKTPQDYKLAQDQVRDYAKKYLQDQADQINQTNTQKNANVEKAKTLAEYGKVPKENIGIFKKENLLKNKRFPGFDQPDFEQNLGKDDYPLLFTDEYGRTFDVSGLEQGTQWAPYTGSKAFTGLPSPLGPGYGNENFVNPNKFGGSTYEYGGPLQKFYKGRMTGPNMFDRGGMITDPRGQWAHPGQNTRIPGGNITMDGVSWPVLAKASNGMSTMMYPGQDYNFPGASYVDEYPLKKKSINLDKAQVGLQTPITGNITQRYEQRFGGGLDQYQTKGEVTYTHEPGQRGAYRLQRTVSPYTSNRDIKRYTQAPTDPRQVNFLQNYAGAISGYQDDPGFNYPTQVPYEGDKHWNVDRFIIDPQFSGRNITNKESLEQNRANVLADMYKYYMLQDPEHKGRAFRKAKRFVRREIDPRIKGPFLQSYNTVGTENPDYFQQAYQGPENFANQNALKDLYWREALGSGNVTPEEIEKLKDVSFDYFKNYKGLSKKQAKEQWKKWEDEANVTKTTGNYKNGGGFLSRTVTCSNCGWSWKAVDGGEDAMTCHKCGGTAKLAKAQNGFSFLPEQDPEMMYTDRFNTGLSEKEQKDFNQWAAEESKRQGRDILMDKGAYDVQGFWKSGDYKKMDQDNHGTDTWKKPNHPTFSNQSRYHGMDGFYGGNWNPDGGYQPSKQSAGMYGPSYYKRMFAEEPGRIEHLDASRYMSGLNRPSPFYYKQGGVASNKGYYNVGMGVPRFDEGGNTEKICYDENGYRVPCADEAVPIEYTFDKNDPNLKKHAEIKNAEKMYITAQNELQKKGVMSEDDFHSIMSKYYPYFDSIEKYSVDSPIEHEVARVSNNDGSVEFLQDRVDFPVEKEYRFIDPSNMHSVFGPSQSIIGFTKSNGDFYPVNGTGYATKKEDLEFLKNQHALDVYLGERSLRRANTKKYGGSLLKDFYQQRVKHGGSILPKSKRF